MRTRKTSVALTNLTAPPDTPMRKKLQLLPRTISTTNTEGGVAEEGDDRSEASTELEAGAETPPSMTEEQSKGKVEEDVKELFTLRDLGEAEKYFESLPEEHKSKLVDKLVDSAINSKEDDVKLVVQLFQRVAGKSCSIPVFETAFGTAIEFLDDMAIDIPQAYSFMARLVQAAGLSRESVEVLAGKIYCEGDSMLTPKDKFIKAYDKLA